MVDVGIVYMSKSGISVIRFYRGIQLVCERTIQADEKVGTFAISVYSVVSDMLYSHFKGIGYSIGSGSNVTHIFNGHHTNEIWSNKIPDDLRPEKMVDYLIESVNMAVNAMNRWVIKQEKK